MCVHGSMRALCFQPPNNVLILHNGVRVLNSCNHQTTWSFTTACTFIVGAMNMRSSTRSIWHTRFTSLHVLSYIINLPLMTSEILFVSDMKTRLRRCASGPFHIMEFLRKVVHWPDSRVHLPMLATTAPLLQLSFQPVQRTAVVKHQAFHEVALQQVLPHHLCRRRSPEVTSPLPATPATTSFIQHWGHCRVASASITQTKGFCSWKAAPQGAMLYARSLIATVLE